MIQLLSTSTWAQETRTRQAISLSQALSENEGLDTFVKDVASLMGGLVCDIAEIHNGLFEPESKLARS